MSPLKWPLSDKVALMSTGSLLFLESWSQDHLHDQLSNGVLKAYITTLLRYKMAFLGYKSFKNLGFITQQQQNVKINIKKLDQ